MTYTVPAKEKPMLLHAAILGSLAIAIAVFLTTGYSWEITARTVAGILNLIGIGTEYESSHFLMYVRLPNGPLVGFQVLVECSGLLTIAVFSLISAFTVGLLRGNLSIKLIWFILSVGVGLMWNINRLVLVIAVAYYLGLSSFSFVHLIVGPTIDFIWVVSMWAVGMSWLRRKEEESS